MKDEVQGRKEHNERVLSRMKGLQAQPSTPESDADPRNPNQRNDNSPTPIADSSEAGTGGAGGADMGDWTEPFSTLRDMWQEDECPNWPQVAGIIEQLCRRAYPDRSALSIGKSMAGEALRLLAAEDERQSKLHEILETIREQIRLSVAAEHRPDGLFKNIQDAVYAMRGRTPLMNDVAITAALSAAPVEMWKCAARKQSLPEPADCGWPTCGCDPYADKVIAALEEQGRATPVSQEHGSPDGLPFGIIDPKYAAFYTVARLTAWSYGYAIAMHGSFTRDLDLIAIPWTDAAVSPEELIHQVQYRTGCTPVKPNASIREHGRIVWTLSFPEFDCPRFVDFSIIPPATSAGVGADEIRLACIEHASLNMTPEAAHRQADRITAAILALLSRAGDQK